MEGKRMEDAKRVLLSLLEDIDLAENEVGLVAFGGDEDIWLE
jgi:Mg-chelatase subunit ChlD